MKDKLKKAKIFGGIGLIILLATIGYSISIVLAKYKEDINVLLPVTVSSFIGVIGLILFVVAMGYISDVLNNKSINQYIFLFIIFNIIGGIMLVLGGYFGFGRLSLSELSDLFSNPIRPFFIILGYCFLVVPYYFLKKAFEEIAKGLNISLFREAGIFLFIGALLSIILIGSILILVGWILSIIAFFSIPEMVLEKTPFVSSEIKYCPNCGTKLSPDYKFCPNCGTPRKNNTT